MIDVNAPVISKDLRKSGGYAYNGRFQKAAGKKGFDSTITRLQEQCYVIISDFLYTIDTHGNRRGWGVAEYNTPEKFWGERFTQHVYQCSPEESYQRLFEHISRMFPDTDQMTIKKFLR